MASSNFFDHLQKEYFKLKQSFKTQPEIPITILFFI